MKRYAREISDQRREYLTDSNGPESVSAIELTSEEELQPEEVDISDMLERTKEVLRREIKNLSTESIKGKLKPASSASLTAYVKLLADLLKEEKSTISKLSKEELEKLANETLE